MVRLRVATRPRPTPGPPRRRRARTTADGAARHRGNAAACSHDRAAEPRRATPSSASRRGWLTASYAGYATPKQAVQHPHGAARSRPGLGPFGPSLRRQNKGQKLAAAVSLQARTTPDEVHAASRARRGGGRRRGVEPAARAAALASPGRGGWRGGVAIDIRRPSAAGRPACLPAGGAAQHRPAPPSATPSRPAEPGNAAA